MAAHPDKRVAVLSGDGIGPEVVRQGLRVLEAVTEKYGVNFTVQHGLIGGAAIKATGSPLPPETVEMCAQADAVFLGAVGLPEYDQDPHAKVRPEQGLLGIRKALDLYLNIRPITVLPPMVAQSSLKASLLKDVDLVIYRELSGGIYFGKRREATSDDMSAEDICSYSEQEIVRVARPAFEAAEKRRGRLCLVDKANVLATSRLWRTVVMNMAAEYPSVGLEYMYVDNAAMQLVLNPGQFDVILTSNMFGDILSDLGSTIAGSLGFLPSASIGTHAALFEPVHGSYPQATGKDIANPLGAILSVKMMLEHFEMNDAAADVDQAVKMCVEQQIGTADMHLEHECGCSKLGELIAYVVSQEEVNASLLQKALSATII